MFLYAYANYLHKHVCSCMHAYMFIYTVFRSLAPWTIIAWLGWFDIFVAAFWDFFPEVCTSLIFSICASIMAASRMNGCSRFSLFWSSTGRWRPCWHTDHCFSFLPLIVLGRNSIVFMWVYLMLLWKILHVHKQHNPIKSIMTNTRQLYNYSYYNYA